MSLKIRLARGGTKKRPYYRVVVAESRMPRDGRFVEKVGVYDPMLPRESGERVKLDSSLATVEEVIVRDKPNAAGVNITMYLAKVRCPDGTRALVECAPIRGATLIERLP